jgi:hypothetical protein
VKIIAEVMDPPDAAYEILWPDGWPVPRVGDDVVLHDRNLAVRAVYWNPQGDEDDPKPFVFLALGRP